MKYVSVFSTLALFIASGLVSKSLSLSVSSELVWRLAVATLLSFVYLICSRQESSPFTIRDLLASLIRAVLGFQIAAGAYFIAVRIESFSTVGLLSSLPLLPLCEWVIWRRRLSIFDIGRNLLVVIGLVVFFGAPHLQLTYGALMALLCAFAISITICMRRMYNPSLSLAHIAFSTNGLAFLIALFVSRGQIEVPQSSDVPLVILGGAVFVFSGIFLSYAYGKVSETLIAAVLALEPIGAVFIGVMLYGEPFSFEQVVAGACIVLATLPLESVVVKIKILVRIVDGCRKFSFRSA